MNSPVPHGRISSGISVDAAALKTLDFIHRNLAAWRDDPERNPVERERDLNSQLCKYLNVVARNGGFAMVHFHHEEPQGSQHSADISASLLDVNWIEGRQYTKYDPILLLEGKRLPTPGSGRQREYIASPAGDPPMGGIQRFKLGLHGAAISIAGIVGYIQAENCPHWFDEVNRWIDDLVSAPASEWSSHDRFYTFHHDPALRVSRCESGHSRISGVSQSVRLTHLWVEMSLRSPVSR